MKKSKIITILVILIIAIVVGVSFKLSNDKGNKIKDNNTPTLSDATNFINTNFISQKTERKQIESITGMKISYNKVYVGKDSFVSYKPTSTFIKKYNLEEYEKLQAKYAPKVEEKILSQTTYSYKREDNFVTFTFKPWYYGAYSSDLQYMIESFLNATGEITKEDFSKATEKYNLNEYKARVKSIYILNQYLDDYDNQDETFDFTLELNQDKISNADLYSIFMNLGGYSSKKVTGYFDQNAVESRVSKYFAEARKEGIMDSNDILSIKGLK